MTSLVVIALSVILIAFYVYLLGKIFAAGWIQGLRQLLSKGDQDSGKKEG